MYVCMMSSDGGLVVAFDESGEAADGVCEKKKRREDGRERKQKSVIKVNKSRLGRSKVLRETFGRRWRGGKEHSEHKVRQGSKQTKFLHLRKERSPSFAGHCDVSLPVRFGSWYHVNLFR